MNEEQKRLFATIDEMSQIRDSAIEAEQAGNREQADALWRQLAEFRTEHGLFDEAGSIDDEDDDEDEDDEPIAKETSMNDAILLAMLDAQIEASEKREPKGARDELDALAFVANEGEPTKEIAAWAESEEGKKYLEQQSGSGEKKDGKPK